MGPPVSMIPTLIKLIKSKRCRYNKLITSKRSKRSSYQKSYIGYPDEIQTALKYSIQIEEKNYNKFLQAFQNQLTTNTLLLVVITTNTLLLVVITTNNYNRVVCDCTLLLAVISMCKCAVQANATFPNFYQGQQKQLGQVSWCIKYPYPRMGIFNFDICGCGYFKFTYTFFMTFFHITFFQIFLIF